LGLFRNFSKNNFCAAKLLIVQCSMLGINGFRQIVFNQGNPLNYQSYLITNIFIKIIAVQSNFAKIFNLNIFLFKIPIIQWTHKALAEKVYT
jgi:hypothetical protein